MRAHLGSGCSCSCTNCLKGGQTRSRRKTKEAIAPFLDRSPNSFHAFLKHIFRQGHGKERKQLVVCHHKHLEIACNSTVRCFLTAKYVVCIIKTTLPPFTSFNKEKNMN